MLPDSLPTQLHVLCLLKIKKKLENEKQNKIKNKTRKKTPDPPSPPK